MKKIVFFDIDGTLVDSATRTLPQSAVTSIAALRKKGHLAVINTGRPYTHIDPRVRALEWDGCVSGCGLEVRAGNALIYSAAPTKAQCAKVRELVRSTGMAVFYETEEGYILDGDRYLPPEALLEVERIQADGLKVTRDPDREDFSFQKFIAYDAPGCDREKFQQGAGQDFDLIDRGRGMIEAVLLGNTKSTGIRRILEHFSLAREDAAAFGDSPNDLTMFACVKDPIAMGESSPVLAQNAVYVTSTVLEDGIEKGLQWLKLI